MSDQNDTEELQRQFTDYITRFGKDLESYNKKIKKGTATFNDHISAISELDKAIEKLNDRVDDASKAAERNELLDKKIVIEKVAREKLIQDSVTKLTSKLTTSAITGVGTFTKNLLDNSSASQISNGIMSAGAEMIGAGLSGAGKAAVGVAPLLMGLGPAGIAAASALTILGTTAMFVGDAGSKLAKFGIDVLSKELEKTIKTYAESTSAGALFNRGMDDMRMYATSAGLTLDQFSSVIKNNSGALSESGYTVSGGAKIVANITSRFALQTGKSGQTLQREMLNLGYTFQDQADMAAQITSDLKKTGGTATDGQLLASAVADMAKNMRIVADITGQDAKAKMDQAKKQSEQYAFMAKVTARAKELNDLGLVKRVQSTLAVLDETGQRAFIQATVLGGAVSDVAANVTGQADAGREAANNLMNGNATMQGMLGGFARNGDKMNSALDDVGNAVSIAAIATGQNSEYAAAFGSKYQQSMKLNSQTLDQSIKDAEKTSTASGDMQDGIIDAETAAQGLKMAIQDELTPAIIKFSHLSGTILTGVEDMLDSFGLLSSEQQKARKQKFNETSAAADAYIDSNGTATDKVIVGIEKGLEGIASIVPFIGNSWAKSAAKSRINETSEYAISRGDSLGPGMAKGGIASGPVSGYAEKLHGTEAVVPLPDGRSIPVTLDSSSITNSINQQNSILNSILDTLQKNNQLTSGILQSSY